MSLSSQVFSATSSSPITFLHRRQSNIASLRLAVAPPHLRSLAAKPLSPNLTASARRSRIGVYDSDVIVHRNETKRFNFDSFLSIAEIACLVSSAILTIGFAANWKRAIWGFLGDRVWVWGLATTVCGVLIGALIRRRQWSRICVESVKGGGESFNFVDRIERLEGDLRSSTAIVRALSRQLEKLGIRFRVTRKSLKDPIAESFSQLTAIFIEKGVMPGLRNLLLFDVMELKTLPHGIEYLTKLEELVLFRVSEEFADLIREGAVDRPRVKHIPRIDYYYETSDGIQYENLASFLHKKSF